MRTPLVFGMVCVLLDSSGCQRDGDERRSDPTIPPAHEGPILADPLVTPQGSATRSLEIPTKQAIPVRCGRLEVDVVEVRGCDARDVERQLRQWTSIVQVCSRKGATSDVVHVEFLFSDQSGRTTELKVLAPIDSRIVDCLQMLRASTLGDPPLANCGGEIVWRNVGCPIEKGGH